MKSILKGVFLSCIILLGGTYARSQNPDYGQYTKTMNSLLPGTPEASTMMKYIDFPVSLFTGTPDISIPICEVKGKEISVPVNLVYTATSGIKINEIATNEGLGWNMLIGKITREVRGAPDEGGGSGQAVGLFNNPQPISYYENIINNNQLSQTARDAVSGHLDLEPDLFFFSFCGKSGKFMYDEGSTSFYCTQYQPYKINYDKVAESWTIVSPDGTICLFDKKVQTSTQQECNNILSSGNVPYVTTSWKLSKIINANKTDSVLLDYDLDTYHYTSEGASIKYQEIPEAYVKARSNMNCFNQNSIFGWNKLLKISSAKDTVQFQYSSTARQDLSSQYALEKIIYSNGNSSAKKTFGLSYDYYTRNYVLGILNAQTSSLNKKSLRLKSITNYGNSENNAYPPKWNFFYNEDHDLPARLSYCQDYWGYFNTNDLTSTLAPGVLLNYSNGVILYSDGANRTSDTGLVKTGILQKIQFPTGGTTSFEYESNEVGYPVPLAHVNTEFISIDTTVMLDSTQLFSSGDHYPKTFTINQAPDLYANNNNPNGGVYVDINMMPITTPSSSPYYDPTDLYYELDGPAPTSPILTSNKTHYYLPNGTYTMSVQNAHKLNHAPYYDDNIQPNGLPQYEGQPGRSFMYQISYNRIVPEPSGVINRQLGGLRIKSILNVDSLGNTNMLKRYSYRNPDNDSAYGFYNGSTYNEVFDYMVSNFTPPSGGANTSSCNTYTYLARHGNCVMPGNGLIGASVVYPKVIEYTIEGNKKYKTDYTFSHFSPTYSGVFPFTPAVMNESSHGKLLSTTAYKTLTSNTYSEASITNNNYNFSPTLQLTGATFAKFILGFKVGFAGFTDDNTCGYDHAIGHEYSTIISRSDLVADSTITYDLNNLYNNSKIWHDYVYGDNNQQPILVRTGNSDGSIAKKEIYYAADFPGPPSVLPVGSFKWQLALTNRVNQVLGTKQYKDNALISQQQFFGHFSDSKMLIDSMQLAMFTNPLETEIKILQYDDYADPVLIALNGNKFRKYIWNKKKGLTLATCISGDQNDFFYFSSFEYDTDGGIAGTAFSGNSGYNLSSTTPFIVTTSALNNTDVYFWATTTTGIFVNGAAAIATGKTKGQWSLYKSHISSGASNVTISYSNPMNSVIMDQLVILPSGSQFQGVVYDSGNRIITTINDQIATNFYEYDEFDRLNLIRDEQGNILKSIKYQYQGAQ